MNDVPTQTGGSVETENPQAIGQQTLEQPKANLQGATGNQADLPALSGDGLKVYQCTVKCEVRASEVTHLKSNTGLLVIFLCAGLVLALLVWRVVLSVMSSGYVPITMPEIESESEPVVPEKSAATKPKVTRVATPRPKKSKKTKRKKRH